MARAPNRPRPSWAKCAARAVARCNVMARAAKLRPRTTAQAVAAAEAKCSAMASAAFRTRRPTTKLVEVAAARCNVTANAAWPRRRTTAKPATAAARLCATAPAASRRCRVPRVQRRLAVASRTHSAQPKPTTALTQSLPSAAMAIRPGRARPRAWGSRALPCTIPFAAATARSTATLVRPVSQVFRFAMRVSAHCDPRARRLMPVPQVVTVRPDSRASITICIHVDCAARCIRVCLTQ
ncbi:MAG: hypothetical protein RL701_4507 [Pseudomonadota bacterium]